MNLLTVQNWVRQNNTFDTDDSNTGSIQISQGNFHTLDYGPSAFFNTTPAHLPTTQTVQLDSVPFTLKGKNEDEVAKAYLTAFYFWLLMKQQTNQPSLPVKCLNSSVDIDNLFGALPGKYSSDVCILGSHIEFSTLLNVPYSTPALRIQFQAGRMLYNRDLLSWGEPLVLVPGMKRGRLIAASRTAIVLNVPQVLTPAGKDLYSTNLEFKVIEPTEVLVHKV